MSWQKCDSAEFLLAVPKGLSIFVYGAHIWIGCSLFCLQVSPDLVVLLLIPVVRSWVLTRRNFGELAGYVLVMDHSGAFHINERFRNPSSDCINDISQPATCGFNGEVPVTVNDGVQTVVTQRENQDPDTTPLQYTCCRSVRVPGCVLLELASFGAKPLEILIFYRYDRRHEFRQLLRWLALQ